MQVTLTDHSTSPAPALYRAGRDAAATRTAGERAATARPDEARRVVGELVGNIFYGTLIKQMQASAIRGPYGHGGRGEEVFQGQLGMELAKRIGTSENEPLSTALYRAIAGRPEYRDAIGDANLAGRKTGAAR